MHVFDVTTCGEKEIAHLDGSEVSDLHSYEIVRQPDGSKLLTLRLLVGDIHIVSEDLSTKQ